MTSPVFDSEKVSYEEFKESFMNYVKENTDNKHITLAKSKHITEICNHIECLVCLDTMSLWKHRHFFSTFAFYANKVCSMVSMDVILTLQHRIFQICQLVLVRYQI